MIAVVYLLLLIVAFVVIVAIYDFSKYERVMKLKQFERFVKVFEPDSWVLNGILVMRKGNCIYALTSDRYTGRLVRCRDGITGETEKEIKRMVIRRKLIVELNVKGYKFRVYKVDPIVLPNPDKKGEFVLCRDCIEVSWYLWRSSPIYIDPNVLKEVFSTVESYKSGEG